ncbi:MAG: MarR family winged helix-turn-helix transcriptional regulator [Actinomycetota bacterium]
MNPTEGDELATTCMLVQATCGCEGLRRSARTMTQHYEQALSPSGLRATQLPILVALGWAGPVPLTKLAEGLALDRTTLTRNLKTLQERGFVGLADTEDGRVHLVRLTGEGRQVLTEALAGWASAQSTVEERFGKERLAHLLGELSELMAAVHA